MNHNKEKGITTMKKKNLIMIATSAVFLLSTMFGKEMSNEELKTFNTSSKYQITPQTFAYDDNKDEFTNLAEPSGLKGNIGSDEYNTSIRDNLYYNTVYLPRVMANVAHSVINGFQGYRGRQGMSKLGAIYKMARESFRPQKFEGENRHLMDELLALGGIGALATGDTSEHKRTRARIIEEYINLFIIKLSLSFSNSCLLYTSPRPRDQRGARLAA